MLQFVVCRVVAIVVCCLVVVDVCWLFLVVNELSRCVDCCVRGAVVVDVVCLLFGVDCGGWCCVRSGVCCCCVLFVVVCCLFSVVVCCRVCCSLFAIRRCLLAVVRCSLCGVGCAWLFAEWRLLFAV